MHKLVQNGIITLVIFLHIFLGLIYCNNQVLSSDGVELLQNGLTSYYDRSPQKIIGDTLYSSCISLPMKIYESLFSPLILLIILKLCAFYIIYEALKHYFAKITMVWFSIIYLLSPWLLYNINISYSTYLDIGVALFIFSVCKLATPLLSRNASFFYTLILMMGIGWCLQFHSSWIMLLIITLLLLIRKAIKLHIWGFITGLVLLTLVTIPVLEEIGNNLELYQNRIMHDGYFGYGLIHIYPIFKSILYWVRYASTLFPNNILVDVEFSWLTASTGVAEIIKRFWFITLCAIGGFTILISACGNYLVIAESKKQIFTTKPLPSPKDFFKILSIFALIALLIYTAFARDLLSSREITICLVFALLPLLLVFEKYHLNIHQAHYFWMVLTITFLFTVNLCSAVNSNNYNTESNYLMEADKLIEPLFN